MTKIPHSFFAAWLCILPLIYLTGCSSLSPRADATAEPAPVVDLTSPSASTADNGPVLRPAPPPASESISSNRATLGLLAQADRLQAKGELEASAAALERALRIEPRNARLWNRLALIRLAQGKTQLAANLAAKSNSLAGKDSDLIEKNDEIIRDARFGQ